MFVKPPSREEQRRRLVERGEDDAAEIERRLAAAATEEALRRAEFDAVVVNDDVDAAVDEVAGILDVPPIGAVMRPFLSAVRVPDARFEEFGVVHMAERRTSLMTPRMESLLERVDSKFTLVTLSAMRAREINDYYNQLGEGLGKIVPPQVNSVSRKPLSISLEEIEVGKIEAVPLPEEVEDEAEGADGTDPTEPIEA